MGLGWYEQAIFNRVLEHALDQPAIQSERVRTLLPVHGTVLEAGIGTGLNVPCYPERVRRITALSRDRTLDERAAQRARARRIAVSHVSGDAHRLPFQSEQFDTVVCTFLLCTVADPATAIAEFARVLRPGGHLLFLEHVLGDTRGNRLLQRAFSPLARAINCGCSPARDTAALLRGSSLCLDVLEEYDQPDMPWLYRRLIRGAATRPLADANHASRLDSGESLSR
jgi:SAM-dependent methyltransferase